jgi:transcription antitermination factor NusG
MANWYVVYTRDGCETKVAEILSRKLIENFCPLIRSVKKINNVRKIVLEPLFTSFVFVRMNKNDLHKLKSIDKIISVVCWLQNPAIVKDIEIEMMKRFLNAYKTIDLEKTGVITNEIVKIIIEPMAEKKRTDTSISNDKIKLLLPSLGYSMVTVVENENEKDLAKKKVVFG